ncbi:MAG: transposase [Dehalococcoidia bacterium]|nr:transposase [Dehalococcoidia bacterium]MYK61965.1 transposase [Chloroflexota bacterium]
MHHESNTKDGFEGIFGYKLHMAACASYDFPIAMRITVGNANDSPRMIPVVQDTESRLNGFPKSVVADPGYDAKENSEWVDERGGAPIIHKRKPQSGLHQGEYTADGIPVCECGEPREYAFTNPTTGVHYYGEVPDCRSEDNNSLCFMSILVNPKENIRLFGAAARSRT